MICQAKSSIEKLNDPGEAIVHNQTCEPEMTYEVASNLKSVHVQTIPVDYFGRSQSTQTSKKLEGNKTMATKGTQTCITSNSLLKYLLPKMVSACSQTDRITVDVDKDVAADNNEVGEDNHSMIMVQLPTDAEVVENDELSDPIKKSTTEHDGDESGDEYIIATSGEESELEEGCSDGNLELNDEPIILSKEKSIEYQLKFIVCEGSIATTFGVCLKCESNCSVSVTNIIGGYCKINISCLSSAKHNITWSTGPLLNRLPSFNLLMASTILSTGMESSKTIRFLESLNILCLKRRELSNIQSAYVIPAVVNVWKKEQHKLLNEIKGKPIEIASDMRVDSPGHCGLLGAGSTLDVDRNVILDTQIIKVICLNCLTQ